jgi:hypothetical protein
MTATFEVSSRYLSHRGLSDGLKAGPVEVSSHYLPRRGFSDGLMTAVVAAVGEELAGELVRLLVHAVHTQTNLSGPHALLY